MKRILRKNKKLFTYFFFIISLSLSACSGMSPTVPVISTFTADFTTITEGESVTLSWAVTDASTVTITPGLGTVALSGSTSVNPTNTTTYTLTAIKGTESITASVTIIIEKTLTIQPGPEEGMDTFVYSKSPDENFGSSYLCIGSDYTEPLRTFIRFNLSGIPSNAVIERADLNLYHFQSNGGYTDFVAGLHRVTEIWQLNAITWNNQVAYYPIPESITSIDADAYGWLSWDITSLLQGWLDGNYENNGIVLKDMDESMGNTWINCLGSRSTLDADRRPKLEITYYVP